MIFTVELRSTKWQELEERKFSNLEDALDFMFSAGPHSKSTSSIVTEIDGKLCFLASAWHARERGQARFYAYSTIRNTEVKDIPFVTPEAVFEAKDKTWTKTH